MSCPVLIVHPDADVVLPAGSRWAITVSIDESLQWDCLHLLYTASGPSMWFGGGAVWHGIMTSGCGAGLYRRGRKWTYVGGAIPRVVHGIRADVWQGHEYWSHMVEVVSAMPQT